uniref:Glycosyltransferase 2-like domain-containing protein n=1 Tax=Streptococcus suis TaxID=1307 RepID=A0A1C9IE97_STRSU|nr:hypothetical protein YS394-orf13 [Streptococcus suis]
MKEYYKHIFVVLVYRNTTDIVDFINSVREKVTGSKIIIVNSYYDDESLEIIRNIANRNKCDFLNVENKGFSYGNNIGLKHALANYHFDFVTCSNPDVIIRKFDDTVLNEFPDSIYGPEITTVDNRKQNPMMIYRNDFIYSLIYSSYTKKKRYLFIIAVLLSKIIRTIGRIFKEFKALNSYPVFQLHGCFIIFSRKYLAQHGVPFDENMFLFGEEGVLAYEASQKGTKLIYTKEIDILHKEDGSMSLFSGDLNNELVKSNIYFYEKYLKGKS